MWCRADSRVRMLPPALGVVGLLAVVLTASAADGPVVGSWATYEWKPSLSLEVPVMVSQPGASGQAQVTLEKGTASPRSVFVTYGIVKADAKSYVLQVVTRPSLDGPTLSVTQITVDRATGKALRSVIRGPKGPIVTPESEIRPFREAAVKGSREDVTVPAGRFSGLKTPYRDGSAWVSDQVPATGLVRATSDKGQLELVRSGASGARDLLRS